MSTFAIGDSDFLLDGTPLQIISGALHYFRVHPDLWADRIRKARLMGLNTIETYVPWNAHSRERGQFDTSGPLDLGRFLELVAAEGMHAIVRPGPYICAEWDNGGLPAWLFVEPGVGIRRNEPTYMAAVAEYLADLLPVIASHQVTHGGPVLLVQVENEYGAYGEDKDYLRALVQLIRAGGIDVPLVTCDQADDAMLERGGLPEIHRTVTFGSRSTERLATLRRHQPTGPLMCMEYWNGWFDTWGLPHHVTSPEATSQDLDDLLASGASVNLYMFHGGTNFGLTNGANDKGMFQPITTSYDYDAPLAEDGSPTAKYHAMRKVISRYANVPDELPDEASRAPELDVVLDRRLSLWEVLGNLAPARSWDHLPTVDEVAQWSGFTLYRTRVDPMDQVVSFDEVRDRAVVFLDREPVGVLSRSDGTRAIALPVRDGVLELLVENQGRVNYGPRIGEAKGLIGRARTAVRDLTEWETIALPLEELDPHLVAHLWDAPRADGGQPLDCADPVRSAGDTPVAGPAFWRAVFPTVAGADHFLRLDGWGRGFGWVNGFPLGRYVSQGPTRTMYVPGSVLVAEGNEIVVLELHATATSVVSFVAGPDLGVADV